MQLIDQQTAPPHGRKAWWPLVAVLAVVVVLLGGYAIYRAVRPHATVVWSDDFTGAAGTLPSKKDWLFTTGTSYPGGAAQFGTGEIQAYTDDPANVHLDGKGHLVITATRDATGGWRSARIETHRTDFQPGTGATLEVSARLKVPALAQGYWPAFWMLGEAFRGNYTNWPRIGEIDIMENGGRRFPNTVFGTLHCGSAPGGPCNENNGISGKYTAPGSKPLSADFHTFAVQWDRSTSPEEIRWYMDGHRFHTVRADAVDAQTWADATHHGFYVLIDLAIGGALPGSADATTAPGGALIVDTVSVSRI